MAPIVASNAEAGDQAMSDGITYDPLYVAARRVLLDALSTLAPHGKAIVVVGAQAVYLRTDLNDIALTIAPYTTDGDLALDPTLLGDETKLEESMRRAGFQLLEQDGKHAQPGTWCATETVNGKDVVIPIDLIVPEAAISSAGRRGARLGAHGNQAARRVVGLEAALVDHGTMTVAALDPLDDRQLTVEVAGFAALLVAKAHKIHDRVASGRANRLSDKDASDVFRIMQAASPTAVAATFDELLRDPLAGEVTLQSLEFMEELFARRAGYGIVMAKRALRLAVDEAQVETLCMSFATKLLETRQRRVFP